MDVRWLFHLLLLSILGTCISSDKYKLGGIFENAHRRQTNIFRRASILYGVDVMTETVERNDFLASSKAVCRLLKEGVAGIFVPPTVSTAQHIAAECSALNIPIIRSLVNVYLIPDTLTKLYVDLINKLKWNSFTLLYEDSTALMHYSELLKTFSSISLRQLDANRNNRELLQEMQESEEKNFVIDCKDLHTLDLEPYQYSGTRIIGFKAIEPVNEALQILKMEEHNVNVSSAFVYDSVLVYAQILQKLDLTFTSRECEEASDMEHASVIADYITNNEVLMHGMTGRIELDKSGNRTNMELQILQLQENGLTTIGRWNSSDILKFSKNLAVFHVDMDHLERKASSSRGIRRSYNASYKLAVVRYAKTTTNRKAGKKFGLDESNSSPYVMKKYTGEDLHGSDRFEGYVIDMLEELSQVLGFTYELKINYEYGSLDPQTNKWTGMLHELQMGRADMVVADLTISTERYFAFEFTMPFINTGISILYFKPSPHHGFSVLSLFSLKLSPFQRHSIKNSGQFTFENSLWFAVASLRPLGCGIEPKDSSDPMFQRMYTEMVSSPDVLVPSTEAGMERVKTEKGGYAFLTDALTIEYAVMCDPDLIQVGGLLNYKGFGIALPHGSPHRKFLNAGLLRLKESGRLFALKVRWWHRPCHALSAINTYVRHLTFSSTNSDIHSYDTRHKNNVIINRCNTSLCQQYMDHMGTHMYSCLPLYLREIPALSSFKKALFKFFTRSLFKVPGQNPTISVTKPTPEVITRRRHQR
ncbi:hypothetical protein C0J52_16395 [Blattella germanica]|nr:hypothetical protein C0J52_16395 [Blattella germanica]